MASVCERMVRVGAGAALAVTLFALALQAQVTPPTSAAREPEAPASESAPPRSAPPAASADATPRSRPAASPLVLNAGLGQAPDVVSRTTPREAVQGFMQAGRAQEYARASHYLNLSRLAPAEQRRTGARLAHELFEVLENQVWFDMEDISDDPLGGADKGAVLRDVQVAAIPIKGGAQGIRLTRVSDAQGRPVWVFSQPTVDAIRDLHKRYGPPAILDRLPDWAKDRPVLGLDAWQWGGLVLLITCCWAFGLLVEKLAGFTVRAVVKRRRGTLSPDVTRRLEKPAGWITGLLALLVVIPMLRMTAAAELMTIRFVYIGIILALTRAAIGLINYGATLIEKHSLKTISEELKRRAIATQVATMRRIAVVLVVLVGTALALMQFPVVRTVGWSLLGSAGIAGAILGFAAQKTFANIFAGIVISITQPIRIGDTVVVQNEWGQIEEIGTTHVVVKLWDLRRLVLPIVFFLDQPFENWTRTDLEVVGTVRVHANYRVCAQEARSELEKILGTEPQWNGKTGSLIVEELTHDSVVLRASVSADDASKLWDLRCHVRERMLDFLQKDTGRIPVRRVEQTVVPPSEVPAR
jgi:small-conductance mechanosensitive channel